LKSEKNEKYLFSNTAPRQIPGYTYGFNEQQSK